MKSKIQVAALLLMFLCTASISTSLTVANPVVPVGCDDKGASTSVGACKDGVWTCEGIKSETVCNVLPTSDPVYVVKNDFPTACVDQDKSSCDEPLADCYGPITCTWANGACNPSGDPAAWMQIKKKKSTGCVKVGAQVDPL